MEVDDGGRSGVILCTNSATNDDFLQYALLNDIALHYFFSLSVRGPVCIAGEEGGEERRELVLVD